MGILEPALSQRVVTVGVLGGLGNQMFQYATARAVAQRNGASLLLDWRAFDAYTLRRPGLHRWNIDAQTAAHTQLRRHPRWAIDLSRRVRPLGRVLGCHVEKSLAFDPHVMRLKAPVHLSGYFQSERYFAEIRHLLMNQFSPRLPLSSAHRAMAEAAAASPSISVHVRRGDYVSEARNLAVHGSCSVAYYARAIEMLQSRYGPATCYFFSDDLDWVREHLPRPAQSVYVEGNADAPEVDIHLMAACRHHVCANSSFSWWGAWLGWHPDKCVVAPARWFAAEELDAGDLVPATWLRLD
jgi:Glycosyl transferase family 11